MRIEVIQSSDLKGKASKDVEAIRNICFRDVPETEKKENFYAKPFASMAAHEKGKLIGTLQLFKRRILFDSKKISLGGIGGVCVKKERRRRGVATKMIKTAMEALKKKSVILFV